MRKQWYNRAKTTGKWELEMKMETFLGFSWGREKTICMSDNLSSQSVHTSWLHEVMKSTSIQGCVCRTGILSSCDEMLGDGFCMMEFPRLLRETWNKISKSVFTCDWGSEILTICHPPSAGWVLCLPTCECFNTWCLVNTVVCCSSKGKRNFSTNYQ